MPSIKKIITGKMNSDASNDLMPQEDFRDALNLTVDVDGVISVRGNRRFKDSYLAEGYWCAGAYYDKRRRRIYAFLAHENQQHRFVVVHVDVEAVVTIWENITDSNGVDILGWDMPEAFDASKVIKSIRVVHRDFGGDMVYFIDPNGVPLKYNFEKLAGGEYGDDLTLSMFKVLSTPPAQPPTVTYSDDLSRNVNNLKKKLFQFRYRYVYLDDEKSVWSAASVVPLPPKNNDDDYYADGTKANLIQVSVSTGIKTVKKIEVAARVNVNSSWTDYFLVDTLDKSELSLSDGSSYTYRFYNDGAYNTVDVEESNLLFDYVPYKVNCLELANGNIIVMGGITEGFDKEVGLDVSASVSAIAPVVGNLQYRIEPSGDGWRVYFTGSPTQNDGIIVETNWNRIAPSLSGVSLRSYTVLSGDTVDDVINDLSSPASTIQLTFTKNLTEGYIDIRPKTGYEISSVTCTIEPFTASGDTDSVSVLKWLGRYGFGIVYYSADGKTRGVYVPTDDSWTVDTPAYSESTGTPQVPSVELSINNAPPSWADYYHIVMTNELTAAKSLIFVCSAVDEDTDYGYFKIENLTETITDFPSTAKTLKYDFAEGDRVRVLSKVTGTSPGVLNSYEFEILGIVEKTSADYIKVRKASNLPSLATTSDTFLIEIYAPAKVIDTNLNVYYEIGKRFPIYVDKNNFRSHGGQEQAQVQGTDEQPAKITITSGDYYYRKRTLKNVTDFFTMDANFSDYWQSAVWSQGRPLVIDDSIKKQYYPGLIRHSLQYIQGTNVNRMNRFYPENFEEADASYGDVLNMKTRENFIRVFQRFKIGSMPVFRQIFIDSANSSNVALSERVLNKINYYAGDYGIDKYGLSLVSTDFGDYFIDDINRAFVRASLDGITNIGDALSMVKFFNTEVENGYTGIGAFDYERREVIIKILNTDNKGTKVVRFSESRKGFQPRLSFTDAEAMLFVDGFLWTFKGVPYVHDNEDRCVFYDEETAPFMTLVFNGGQDFKKTFTNVSMVSNRKWGCTSIKTSTGQSSELKIEDFVMRKDGYHAALLRDSLSPGGLLRGDTLKGNWIELKLEGGAASSLSSSPSVTSEYELTLCAVYFNESNLNKR